MRAQKGDTIVEVLVAIAVASLVLAAAFAATRQGQLTSQRTDERGQATKVLEQQTELLKFESNKDDIYALATGSGNCINPSTFALEENTVCTIDGRYDVWFSRIGDNTFQIQVEWDRLGGNEGTGTIRENATNYYKVYKR